MTPLHISLMLACHCSCSPEEWMGKLVWNSSAGKGVREWLAENDLIDSDNRSTDRGKAWVEGILSTPLPLVTWRIPDRERL